jgi:hypothetical protein
MDFAVPVSPSIAFTLGAPQMQTNKTDRNDARGLAQLG